MTPPVHWIITSPGGNIKNINTKNYKITTGIITEPLTIVIPHNNLKCPLKQYNNNIHITVVVSLFIFIFFTFISSYLDTFNILTSLRLLIPYSDNKVAWERDIQVKKKRKDKIRLNDSRLLPQAHLSAVYHFVCYYFYSEWPRELYVMHHSKTGKASINWRKMYENKK